jgi:hypothetical protein
MPLAFDGATNRVVTVGDVAAADITGTAFTACAWIKQAASPAGGAIVAKSSSAATDAYNLAMVSGKVNIDISDSGGADSCQGATVLDTAWHHIACVKAGTGAGALKVYVDGVEDGSATSNRSIQNAAAALTFGRRASSEASFNGNIAECAIWAASLKVEELLAIANGVLPIFVRPQSLRGYWPLWNPTSPERDYTQHNNDGTVSNGIVVFDSWPPVMPMTLPRVYTQFAAAITHPTAPFPPLSKSMAALLRR